MDERDLVEAIDVLGHRGLEEQQWVETSRRNSRGERLHFSSGGGRDSQNVTNPSPDQPGRGVDDGAIQKGPASTSGVLEQRYESRPLRAFRLAQRLLDDGEQRSPLWMLRVQDGQQRSAGGLRGHLSTSARLRERRR